MNRQSRRSGFTLIELLVVIAIIALLAALLLPSLGRAKYRARLVACRSNLKQVATIAHLYAVDYNGFYPHRNVYRDRNWSAPHTVKYGAYDDRQLWREMGLDRFSCPFTKPVDLDSSLSMVFWSYSFFFGSYYWSSVAPGMEKQVKWNGKDSSGMWKVGQHIRRADGTEFDILASDVNMSFLLTGGNTVSSHPDPDHRTLVYDLWAEGVAENGFLSTQGGAARGACDYNFVREDGSAFLMQRVEWDDSRLSRIPYKMDNNGKSFEIERWTLLPSLDQCR